MVQGQETAQAEAPQLTTSSGKQGCFDISVSHRPVDRFTLNLDGVRNIAAIRNIVSAGERYGYRVARGLRLYRHSQNLQRFRVDVSDHEDVHEGLKRAGFQTHEARYFRFGGFKWNRERVSSQNTNCHP